MAKVGANKIVFAIISNIPSSYHSSDLRNYFSQFIESKGFHCFHFRHRPEALKDKCDPCDSLENASSTSFGNTHKNEHGSSLKTKGKRSTCCVIKLEETKYKEFSKMYNKRHWLDRRGNSIPSLCIIKKIKISQDEDPSQKYVTRGEQRQLLKEKETFSQNDIDKLPELHPPVDVMPNGNVGTPTNVFLQLIQQCKLPPAIIKKLGLTFPKTRSNRRYGNVPMDYGTDFASNTNDDMIETNIDINILGQVISGKRHEIEFEINMSPKSTEEQKKFQMEGTSKDTMKELSDESAEDDDDDGCEEWERHEALYDDPTNAERNKERLFEEEIELKWEKGGSGLVFYTDAQYWKEQEGDFDEQTADDWDVDMSVYYEENGGDKDARDYVSMRQIDRWKSGEEATDMRTGGFIRDKKKDGLEAETKIGSFEKHTKGIGRKVLKRHGWSEGEGLGSSKKGISDALGNEGQVASDKTGFGYHGVKLDRSSSGVSNSKQLKKDFIISTIYDNPAETDPTEPLLRRNHHSHIKYRHGVRFHKAQDSE